MTTRTPLAASAILLLLLAGCSAPVDESDTVLPGGGTGATDGATEEELEGSGTTACISRTWALDIPDSAAQLGDFMSTNGGINVTQSEGSGVQLITFDEGGTASMTNDVSYVVTVVDEELTFTMVQTHSGDTSGEWEWTDADEDTITFPAWENGEYTIQTQMLVNGTATENESTLPSETLGSGSLMTVECSGDSLTTKVSESPFTHHWTARD